MFENVGRGCPHIDQLRSLLVLLTNGDTFNTDGDTHFNLLWTAAFLPPPR